MYFCFLRQHTFEWATSASTVRDDRLPAAWIASSCSSQRFFEPTALFWHTARVIALLFHVALPNLHVRAPPCECAGLMQPCAYVVPSTPSRVHAVLSVPTLAPTPPRVLFISVCPSSSASEAKTCLSRGVCVCLVCRRGGEGGADQSVAQRQSECLGAEIGRARARTFQVQPGKE